MTSYLHVRSGPHHVLLDLAHVVEVGAVPGESAVVAGHRSWRDRSLPVLDLGAALGVPAATVREQVVVHARPGDAERLTVLDVDAVVGIRDLPEEELFVFPLLADALARMVDRAWLDRDTGTCLLRLRHPFCAPDNPATDTDNA